MSYGLGLFERVDAGGVSHRAAAQGNISYNYYPELSRAFGKRSVRAIYGLTGRASVPKLIRAWRILDKEAQSEPPETDGGWSGARWHVSRLLSWALEYPDHVWSGD